MDLLTLLLLSTALAPVSASPIAPPGAQRHAAHASQGSQPHPLAASTAASGDRASTPPTPTPAPPTRVRNGAPMKPIRNRRDISIIMDSGVVDLWPASDVRTVVLGPSPTTGACTTTIIEQIWDPCFWDGTTTIYPSTTTLLAPIDCGLCADVYVPKAIYFCPNQKINGTRRMSIPSTSWSTVCAAATTTPAAGVNQPAPTTTGSGASPAAQTPAVAPAVEERAPFAVASKAAPTVPAVAERAPFAVASAKTAPTPPAVAERAPAPFAVASAKTAPTPPAVAEREPAPFAVAAKPASSAPAVAARAPAPFAVASAKTAPTPPAVAARAPAPFAVAVKPAIPTPTQEVDSRSPKPPARFQALDAAACPTTLVVQPEKSAGKTSTRYATYTTTTVTVDCSGCSLVISTALAGFGPPFSFATTTTVSVGAATTWACR